MSAAKRNNAAVAPTEPLQDVSNANATNVAPTSTKRGPGRPRKSSANPTPPASGLKRRSGRLREAASSSVAVAESDESDDEWTSDGLYKLKQPRQSNAEDTAQEKRRRGRPRKSAGPVGTKVYQPTSGPRVLLKLRFAAHADQPEESKTVSVAIGASTVVVFDGIRDALERAEKEPSDWSVLTVHCFDKAFEELVEVRGDDGLESLRKYEVQLQRANVVEEQEEKRDEKARDEKEAEKTDEEDE